jgi:succinate dehydrogenase/fumarate reductase flavoprotein subunit
MWEQAGPFRTGEKLEAALARIRGCRKMTSDSLNGG